MKFVITINIETVESELKPSSPLPMMVMAMMPAILDALGVKPPAPESESRDTEAPPSS